MRFTYAWAVVFVGVILSSYVSADTKEEIIARCRKQMGEYGSAMVTRASIKTSKQQMLSPVTRIPRHRSSVAVCGR